MPLRLGTLSRSSSPASRTRIQGIDAARGCAMVLVCVAHIKDYLAPSAPQTAHLLTQLTLMATPTFLLLSGFVTHHVLSTSRRERLQISLLDRGLFLLVVAHVLLGLADLPELGLAHWLFGRAVITDAIGISLCLAVLVWRCNAPTLLIAGGVLALGSWPIAMSWQPAVYWQQLAGLFLFNLPQQADGQVDIALVPYVGLFLIGMSLNKWTLAKGAYDGPTVVRRLLFVGLTAIALVCVLIALWYLMRSTFLLTLDDAHIDLLRRTLNPMNKWPPGPAYLLFYGGSGLLLTALLLRAEQSAWSQPCVATAAVIGRASLLCFVLQDWLLRLLPAVLRFDSVTHAGFWLAYLALALLVLLLAAQQWDRHGGNRFLTLGLKRLAAARQSSASCPPARTRGRSTVL